MPKTLVIPLDGSELAERAQPVAKQLAQPDAGVCMTTHGRGRIGATALGSVAEQVLREVEVPAVGMTTNGTPLHSAA